jgi:dTDP-glucose 4,6-dehydratase
MYFRSVLSSHGTLWAHSAGTDVTSAERVFLIFGLSGFLLVASREDQVKVERAFRRILVTGGAGFIGSNYVRLLLKDGSSDEIRVLDKFTYSAHRATLTDLQADDRVTVVEGDICDMETVQNAMAGCDAVVNFAAETHVDRSLLDPSSFIQTNIHGTWVLLECVRQQKSTRFLQVSTDEVYGAVMTGSSVESDPLHPRNPYSASKAGAEMMAIAYYETHEVDVVITRGSNTYGPYQYPEKFIPLMITNVMNDEPIPVYGDGLQVRHWIHVEDHARGVHAALIDGEAGEIYNIGSDDERTNIDVARTVVDLLGASPDVIQHVADRPGHDRRYALSSEKLRSLGWEPRWTFTDGIEQTVDWYRTNTDWWQSIRDASFDAYYRTNYGDRR